MVVGTYVHSYDPSRETYQSQIPAMRSPSDVSGTHSPTPIYDALYSEYRRSFRALPGDRSGEEDLDFRGFGGFAGLSTGTYGGRIGHQTSHHSGHQTQHFPVTYAGNWHVHPAMHAHGRQYTGHHQLPAALPPVARRGL
ncbi:hypothetical protein [Streptomyces sp. NPDC050485]|uniref:hypothetical protein n=1 Tax=Streptomyces sp. NPDC050485 TaxID=3365617 RepID=UPI0037967C48